MYVWESRISSHIARTLELVHATELQLYQHTPNGEDGLILNYQYANNL